MTTATKEFASPQAEEAARKAGLELDELTGTGAKGAVTKGDVEKAAGARKSDEPAISHSKPILTSGSSGPEVVELCRRLAAAGYETDYSRGENPFAVLGASELEAVRQFRSSAGVEPDASTLADSAWPHNYVTPEDWQALLEATDEG